MISERRIGQVAAEGRQTSPDFKSTAEKEASPSPLDRLPNVTFATPMLALVELKHLARPVTLESPTIVGVEDHHTLAPTAVSYARALLELETILSLEAVAAAKARRLRSFRASGRVRDVLRGCARDLRRARPRGLAAGGVEAARRKCCTRVSLSGAERRAVDEIEQRFGRPGCASRRPRPLRHDGAGAGASARDEAALQGSSPPRVRQAPRWIWERPPLTSPERGSPPDVDFAGRPQLTAQPDWREGGAVNAIEKALSSPRLRVPRRLRAPTLARRESSGRSVPSAEVAPHPVVEAVLGAAADLRLRRTRRADETRRRLAGDRTRWAAPRAGAGG